MIFIFGTILIKIPFSAPLIIEDEINDGNEEHSIYFEASLPASIQDNWWDESNPSRVQKFDTPHSLTF